MNILGLHIEANRRVTREDVLWCYRHILKREPEDDASITPHLKHRSFRTLVESFAHSAEARFTISEEDVLWCFRHILGREPEEDEPLSARLAHRNFRELAFSFERREQGLRALTREDVIAAYRYVLRREPESEEVIEAHRVTYNFRSLVDALSNAEEVTHPLTLDDVRWCFEQILGRKPRPDEALTPHLAHKDFRALAHAFARREAGLRALTPEDVEWAFQNVLGREVAAHESIEPQFAHHSFRIFVENIANSAEAKRFRKEGAAGVRRNAQIQLAAGIGASVAQAHATHNAASLTELEQCLAVLKGHAFETTYADDLWAVHKKLLREYVNLAPTPGHLLALTHSQALIDEVKSLTENGTFFGFSPDSSRSLVEASHLRRFPSCQFFVADEILQSCPPPLAAALIRNGLRALSPGGIALICAAKREATTPFQLTTWLADSPSREAKYPTSVARVREIAAGQSCDLRLPDQPNAPHGATGLLKTCILKKRSETS